MPWLSIETADGARMRYPLNDLTVSIGRGKLNAIVLSDPKSSAQHCVIRRRTDGTYGVSDAASRNGTYVNGEPLNPKQERLLNDGDMVVVGQTTLRFVVAEPHSDSIAPTVPAEEPAKKGDTTSVENPSAGTTPLPTAVLAESATRPSTTIFEAQPGVNGPAVVLPSTIPMASSMASASGGNAVTEELPQVNRNLVGPVGANAPSGVNMSSLPRPSDVIKSFETTESDLNYRDVKARTSSKQSRTSVIVAPPVVSERLYVPGPRRTWRIWSRMAAAVLVAVPLVALVAGGVAMRTQDDRRSEAIEKHFDKLLERLASVEDQLAKMQLVQSHAAEESSKTRESVVGFEANLSQFRSRHEKVVAETEGLRTWLSGIEKRLNRLDIANDNSPVSKELVVMRAEIAEVQRLLRQIMGNLASKSNDPATSNSNNNNNSNAGSGTNQSNNSGSNQDATVENHPSSGQSNNTPTGNSSLRPANEPSNTRGTQD